MQLLNTRYNCLRPNAHDPPDLSPFIDGSAIKRPESYTSQCRLQRGREARHTSVLRRIDRLGRTGKPNLHWPIRLADVKQRLTIRRQSVSDGSEFAFVIQPRIFVLHLPQRGLRRLLTCSCSFVIDSCSSESANTMFPLSYRPLLSALS